MDPNVLSDSSQVWNMFDKHFDVIVKELTSVPPSLPKADKSINWSYERIMELLSYNARTGKRMRGITVVQAYIDILGKEKVSMEGLESAMSIGWAVEILQASFLVADDVMDQSSMRRGRPAWYKLEGIGLQAINDGMILESCVYLIIKIHCRKYPYYADLVDLFRDVTMYTLLGQSLDMETSEKPDVDFRIFTDERYNTIIKYKTSFYSFYLPVAISFYLTGCSDRETLTEARSILTEMGIYFQIQDDYLDAFGDSEITGKVGIDIESNKCTWLIVNALKLCTQEQRDKLQNNYGQKDPSKKAAVLQIYKDLDLPGHYRNFEEETYSRLCRRIEGFSHPNIPNNVFMQLLNRIYQRKK